MGIKPLSLGIVCMVLLLPNPLWAWNANGHRLIAQIAADEMTPKARRTCSRYNRALNQVYAPQNWINAAVWLDTLRYQHNDTYNAMHYINLSFSEDGTPLPPVDTVNAITAIEQSIQTLQQSSNSAFKKGLALRVLLHVVGDIHQPLHATSRVSERFPEGDRGGNEVMLSKNSVASNLHAYWDRGGGYLVHKKSKKKPKSIRKMAAELEREYPCRSFPIEQNPAQWAAESHLIGLQAYGDRYRAQDDYQQRTQSMVKKRLALAGCRLGRLLNTLC